MQKKQPKDFLKSTEKTKPTSGKSGKAKHPSGLTMERWNWPFKTETERVVVAKWMKKQQKLSLETLPPALV